MNFWPPQDLFGDALTVAADVDLGSVVWAGAGDIVVFPDGSSWAVAVAIIETPDNPNQVSKPFLRFLKQDNTAQSGFFPVDIFIPTPGTRACRLPKVDCTYYPYMGSNRLEVVVAFRFGLDGYDYNIMKTWDVCVVKMLFRYTGGIWQQIGGCAQMHGGGMAAPGTGQTHPDISLDQQTGDIFIAWTECDPDDVDQDNDRLTAKYARHDAEDDDWKGPFLLEFGENSKWRDHDPWFVSLDVGLVQIPDVPLQRVVGFAYTGLFGPGDNLWGCRSLVGWWDTSLPDPQPGGGHEACKMLKWAQFPPGGGGNKYDAGLVKVDIPADNAPYHGGAAVFVQDTCAPTATYEIWGINSLNPAFTLISDPGLTDFDEATWPSLAVHNSTGSTAAVTFFFKDNECDPPPCNWQAFATHWNLETNDVAEPTMIDDEAEGDFSLDVPGNLIIHNWGTSSSLVNLDLGGNNMYWAAWSDRMGGADPNRVRGCVGFADP
ncbi:MAG: hypothetical protein ABIC40_00235 [bacterium]